MSGKYKLHQDAFDFYMNGTILDLKTEIAKSKSFVMTARKFRPKYASQVRAHDVQYDRWKALELLEQLKNGIISKEGFDMQVSIEKGIPND